MFDYFVKEYKEKIYKTWYLSLTWHGILLAIALIVSAELLFFSFQFKWNCAEKISFALLTLLFLVANVVYMYKISKKIKKRKVPKHNIDERRAAYIDKRVKPLVRLLKDRKLYSTEGIDWLVQCCNERQVENDLKNRSATIGHFFTAFIVPVATFVLGKYIRTISQEMFIDIIWYLVVSLLVYIWCIIIGKSIILPFFDPNKRMVEQLKDDLNYIKTQLNQKTPRLKYTLKSQAR